MEKVCWCSKRKPEETEAWVIGHGIAAMASALYLVACAKVPASHVHVLDPHKSLAHAVHQKGDYLTGYDQFAACLPVPASSALDQILASVPSIRFQGSSVLDEIKSVSERRHAKVHSSRASFVIQKGNKMQTVSTKCLGLNIKYRIRLLHLLLRSDSRLGRNQVKDFFDKGFFQSTFWVVWSAQYVRWMPYSKLSPCLGLTCCH